MRIEVSHHAKKRMRQRGISILHIRHILRFPIKTCINHDKTISVFANIENRTIELVYAKKENYINIVTVI
jgi:hypothetical protein